jgi:hypothetical protein
MSTNPEISGSGSRGMSRLAFDAIAGLTGLVETMHGNIGRRLGSFASRPEEKTGGITRLVHRGIRGVTQLAGTGADAALAPLAACRT